MTGALRWARINTEDEMTEAANKTLEKIAQFLEIVETRIALANAKGISVPTTNLAKELSPKFGWEWPQAYHIINTHLDSRPELYIKKGPKGGITLRESDVTDDETKKDA